MIYTACLWLKGKGPVALSKKKVFTKDSLSQNDRGSLMKCLKIRKGVSAKLKRRILTSTFQEYHILPWNNYTARTFENWFRKSRTYLTDKLFSVISSKVNNSIPSAKSQKNWFMKLGTSNCVNYSMSNPKHSAKYAYFIETLASSTARAGTSCEMGMKTTRDLSSTPWISSRFPITTSQKGEPTGTAAGRSQGIAHTTSRTRSRRDARRKASWVYTTGSFARRRSARICMTRKTRWRKVTWDG